MNTSLQHNFPFDPTYGYDLDRLLRVGAPAEPDDFVDFWRHTYEAARNTPLRMSWRPISSPTALVDLFEVEFDSLDGVRVGGWMSKPHDGAVTRGLVVGHGYGGREAPSTGWMPGVAAIFPCARGFHRSARADLPNTPAAHVVHGINSRETYIHRGCVADYWNAVTALLEAFPEVGPSVDYDGGSFGGGIGALMLPWDDRIQRAFLDVPSFGNHPLRVTLPCVGSGEAVRLHYERNPEVLKVLAYFDAATAARHVWTPTMMGAALFDPAVPPPGQFAVYNALSGPKELFVRRAAHFSHPDEAAENKRLEARKKLWFGTRMQPSSSRA